MKFHPREVALMLQGGIWLWLLILLPWSVSSESDTSTTAAPELSTTVNSSITARRNAASEESTTWIERYGKPEINGLSLFCSPATYEDGTKCGDGTTVKPIDKKQRTRRLDPWYHPDNDEKLKAVQIAGRECSISCKSKMCYYSLGQYFDYVCGSPDSSDYKETAAEIKSIQAKHTEYRLLDDGRICWDGAHMGMDYDEKLITKEETAMSLWYEKSVPKSNLRKLQEELSKYCKNKNCELSPEKSTFICGAGFPAAKPLRFFILMLLSSSVTIIPFL